MDYIFDAGQGRKIALYTLNSSIYSCIITSSHATKPTLLAGNYSNNLTAHISDNKLYYSYSSLSNHIVVKVLGETAVKWEFDEHALNLFLTSFDNELLLFFTPKDSTELCLHTLIGSKKTDPLTLLSSIYPDTKVASCLPPEYASLCQKHIIDSEVNIASLKIKKDYLFSITADLEEKYHKKHQELKDIQAKREKTFYESQLDAERKFEEKLQANEALYNKKIKELNTTIDSIKLQYNQLMDTATRYKAEAEKWYKLYTQRR